MRHNYCQFQVPTSHTKGNYNNDQQTHLKSTFYTGAREYYKGLMVEHVLYILLYLFEGLGVVGAGDEVGHDSERLLEHHVVTVVLWGVLTQVLQKHNILLLLLLVTESIMTGSVLLLSFLLSLWTLKSWYHLTCSSLYRAYTYTYIEHQRVALKLFDWFPEQF